MQGRRIIYIVGRDTSNLDGEEIIKTIETVSENTSDGVIGPLFTSYYWEHQED